MEFLHLPDVIERNLTATFAYFDLLAVSLFSISGSLAAIQKKFDFIGVFIVAFFSSVGGGLIRDAIFIQGGPPLVVTSSNYLLVILIGFAVSMFFYRSLSKMVMTMKLVDAISLGMYSVVGASAALRAELVPIAAVLVGMFNAVGAGLIRDVLIGETPVIFKPGRFYAGAAIVGSSLFTPLYGALSIDETLAALIAIVSTFLVRVLSVRFDWRTKPVLKD
ncbi:MAG: trimeric intracellular cation channel family protein [Bacteroidota bacterium]